jgi:hypothetical protein
MMKEMQKSGPSVFSQSVTPKKKLKLIIEGAKFHWEKPAK